MPHERFLDKQDLMQMLHVSLRTLYNWRTKGKLPFVKVEQKIFYRQTDLERLLKTGRGNSEW
ncbi:helix-turn-helix domain-containing protein [Foetidibacter luteolus]|uniref:helix-turn-helix domain-containing protein n=1 Tax=Foetidibacter luteolus TaxID=2608880 RepID=UPI00129AA5CD|nr:helix-turn-helix domain-containing protein [Foetidibacter luteolus]